MRPVRLRPEENFHQSRAPTATPLYSPDGKYLAWRSQARAGFEADKWRLFVQDRQSGKTRDLTEEFDRSVGSFAWAADSKTDLSGTAEDQVAR